MYAEFMDLYLAKESKSSNQVQERTARADSCISTSSHFTRRSLLVQSLSLAPGEPFVTASIIDKIHRLIRKTTLSEHGSLGLEDDMRNETSASKSGSSDLQDSLQNNVSGESGSAEAQSITIEPYGSDEEEHQGWCPHDGDDYIVAHPSFNYELAWSDSSSGLSTQKMMMTSEKEHHDEEDDDHLRSAFLLDTFNQIR